MTENICGHTQTKVNLSQTSTVDSRFTLGKATEYAAKVYPAILFRILIVLIYSCFPIGYSIIPSDRLVWNSPLRLLNTLVVSPQTLLRKATSSLRKGVGNFPNRTVLAPCTEE